MVYVFLANGFEELEALAPIDVLRRAGVEVVTVGVGSDNITASHGVKFITDMTSDQIKLTDDLEMIVLPGGMPGAINLENSPEITIAVINIGITKKLLYISNFRFVTPFFFLKFSETSKLMSPVVFFKNTAI